MRNEVAKLAWRARRLRAMGAGEIAARITDSLRKGAWRGRRDWVAPAPILDATIAAARLGFEPPRLQPDQRADVIAEAERILHGQYTVLNVACDEPEPRWHFDPQFGVEAPLRFGPTFDYRDPRRVGNYRNVWEKSRLQQVLVMAHAYELTGADRFADGAELYLLTWAEQNPFPQGINWASGLEAGLRLISLVWIERFLRGAGVHAELFGDDGRLWPTIYWHQWLIAHSPSVGSSANNHLIGEMTGLLVACLAWPWFAESPSWADMARTTLEREAARQVFPSGLDREQAFHYQLFTLELLLVAALEARACCRPLGDRCDGVVHRMLAATLALRDRDGGVPQYGDGDDGRALALAPIGQSYARMGAFARFVLGGRDGRERAGRVGRLRGRRCLSARLRAWDGG